MNLILASHGALASGIVNAANMVFGQISQLSVVSFEPGEDVEMLKIKYQEIIGSLDEDEEILFLVDLFGGSPYNAAFETTAGHQRMDVITGLSLPMLIDVMGLREMNEKLKAVDVYEKLECSTYVKSCKRLIEQTNQTSEEEDEL